MGLGGDIKRWEALAHFFCLTTHFVHFHSLIPYCLTACALVGLALACVATWTLLHSPIQANIAIGAPMEYARDGFANTLPFRSYLYFAVVDPPSRPSLTFESKIKFDYPSGRPLLFFSKKSYLARSTYPWLTPSEKAIAHPQVESEQTGSHHRDLCTQC